MELIVYTALGIEISLYLTHSFLKDKERHYKLQKTKEVLKKEIKREKIRKPIYMKLTKEEELVFNNILKKIKKDKEIYYFYKTLNNNTPIEDKDNLFYFFNNIQSLKIHKKNKNQLIMLITGDSKIGEYISPNNEITVYNKKNKYLTHELLHMSSNNLEYQTMGFYRKLSEKYLKKYKDLKYEYNEIGRGLNEGYTELLNNRYFKNKATSYLQLQKIALLIEMFFDNKKDMEKAYFYANIDAIIYELNKYIEIDEIIELIIDIDELRYDSLKNTFRYIKIKRKILEIYKKTQNRKKLQNFKKEYKKNYLFKILKKEV